MVRQLSLSSLQRRMSEAEEGAVNAAAAPVEEVLEPEPEAPPAKATGPGSKKVNGCTTGLAKLAAGAACEWTNECIAQVISLPCVTNLIILISPSGSQISL